MKIQKYDLEDKYIGEPGHHSFDRLIRMKENKNGTWGKIEDFERVIEETKKEYYNKGYCAALNVAIDSVKKS